MEFHKLRARAAIVAALTMFFAAFAPGLAFAQSGLLATTANGRVEGRWQDGVRAFKGIPYAAPPVGDLRWRSPRPPASWTGVWPARDFGAPCPQASSKDIHERGMSEDCLTLNVWTPARGTGTKLPVMVWLHGGAFETGWTGLRMYDGSNIANHGVVMVTLNYRLGPLGFFGHPQLTEEAKAESLPTANYGLLDQIAALLWVKRNIEAFGGDASNVTLFGESAGGVSVLAMMTAPAAKGLFHKVIIQSGGGRWVAPSLTERSGNYLSAHEYGEEAARDFGLKPENAIAGLRAKSWEEILERFRLPKITDHTPFIDGELLTSQIEPAFARGEEAPVPVIVGANSYEGVLLRNHFHVTPEEVMRAAAPQLDALSALYPPQLLMTDGFLADHIWGDANFVEPARMIARDHARAGQTVYHYSFDFQPPVLRLLGGSPHGLEVIYALGNLDRIAPFPLSIPLSMMMHRHNYAVSNAMMLYWTNFAKTGNPNGYGALNWPRFTGSEEETLVFGNDGISIERDYLKERLDLVKEVRW